VTTTPSTVDAATTGYEQLTGTYVLDPDHTRLGFVARHAMITKVHGQFDRFTGTLHVDGRDPTRSSAEVRMETASVNTRMPVRDEHLRSGDFLGAPDHPTITFRSTRVEQVGQDRFRVTGDLTVKGATRPVVLDVEYTGASVDDGELRIGFEASATVDRHDWGVSWNTAVDSGGILVGDRVRLQLDVEAVRTD